MLYLSRKEDWFISITNQLDYTILSKKIDRITASVVW